MTYTQLAPYLGGLLSYGIGSFVMYRIMKDKLKSAWAKHADLKEAYQMKIGENRELWLGQQRLYNLFQEYLKSR